MNACRFPARPARRRLRRPVAVLAFGAAVMAIAMGTRQSFGLLLAPVTAALDLDRGAFGLAVAVQNLVWGLAQPAAGMIADRWGSGRVVFVGGLLYAAGLAVAARATGAGELRLGLGLLVGLGLSGTTFAVVLGAVGRLFPAGRRGAALGIASAGGSFGMFAVVPGAEALIAGRGWIAALATLAAGALLMAAFAPALAGRGGADAGTAVPRRALRRALAAAARHRGYRLLTLGFFVCGFQLVFIATHLPAYLADRHLAPWVAGAALSLIGLFNIAGSFACGVLGDRVSKARALSLLYVLRSAVIAAYLVFPPTPLSTLLLAAAMGLLWLGTVPLTSGLVAEMFGPRYMATLFGFVFLSHQVGSFFGAWLGGLLFEMAGSYLPIWLVVIALGLLAAALHRPIGDPPPVPATAA